MSIKISVDSTGDTHGLGENFPVIPFHILLNNDYFEDGVNITPSSLLSFFDKTRQTAQTSAPSTGEYLDFFKENSKDGNSLLHFCMSSDLSAAFSNATRAKEMLPDSEIRIIDTKSLSGGIALLALKAKSDIEQGFAIDTVEKNVLNNISKLQVSFVINSVEFLHAGGRCSSAQKFATTAFSIKPIISMQNGKLGVSKKIIGSFNSAADKYINSILEKAKENADTQACLLLYTEGTDEKLILRVKEKAEEENIFKKLYCYKAGCTITTHCGKDTLGLLYFLK